MKIVHVVSGRSEAAAVVIYSCIRRGGAPQGRVCGPAGTTSRRVDEGVKRIGADLGAKERWIWSKAWE